jgi:hypothetical protein
MSQPTWMTPLVPQEALLQVYIGKHHTPRTNREKYATNTPAHKKQPQDSNQEAPGSGSSRLPRRLRRACFTEVAGRSARPQCVAPVCVHPHLVCIYAHASGSSPAGRLFVSQAGLEDAI